MSSPAISDRPVRVRERKFNTAGPSIAADHYMLDPLVRIHYEDIEDLIDDKRYFILHAPRQTGKTTALLALMKYLNAGGRYAAVYANIEGAQTARSDVRSGLQAVTQTIARSIELSTGDVRMQQWIRDNRAHNPNDLLLAQLTSWTRMQDKSTVLLLDEVDALVGDTLISLLRQLRAGYAQRPEAFPQAVILCGVRDVKDYRIQTTQEGIITGGSAFNIKAKSLTLGNFTQDECQALWLQHTEATGQHFDPAIFPELWLDTWGQPWLVNALAHELTWENHALRDRSITVSLEHYHAARALLIQSRATHLDQLADKMKEPRVHRVVAPLLQSEDDPHDLQDDDLQYVEDLGLIRRRPRLCISNRIYREVLPRELIIGWQTGMSMEQAPYLTADHRIDMPKLLASFQQFFREHSESWLERFAYREAGPQLLLQAYLQRIINGGGRIHREYGLGMRRTDLAIEWAVDEARGYWGPVQRIVLELKIQRATQPDGIIAEGLPQVVDYAQRWGADEAHLLIFNARPKVSWKKKVFHRAQEHEGVTVQVWGL